MYKMIQKRFTVVILAGLIFTVMGLAPGIGPMAEAGSSGLGRSGLVVTGETPVHPGYPRLFDTVGTIERLTAGKTVIGDTLYPISNSASYHVPGPREVSMSRLHVGDYVGCLHNADGEIESIWLISRNSR